MELTLVGPSIAPVSTESGKDFLDVSRVLLQIIRVYQDIIQVFLVYYYGDVNHVGEDVIHEPLETRRGIGERLGHHQPLKRPILGPEGGLPFVTIGDVDEVVGMLQVDLGIDLGLAWSI